MNKFLQKLAKLFLGISMAAGVGVAIGANNTGAGRVDAASNSGTYTKVTTANGIAAGDTIIIVNTAETKAIQSISTTSTKYGTLSDVSATSNTITLSNANVEEFTVETGYNSTGFSFKGTSNISGNYLTWTSGNSLNKASSKSANTSWTITASSGTLTIANNSDSTRKLRFNSDRFACYTNSTGTLAQIYKKGASGTAVSSLTLSGTGVENNALSISSTDTSAHTITVTINSDASDKQINISHQSGTSGLFTLGGLTSNTHITCNSSGVGSFTVTGTSQTSGSETFRVISNSTNTKYADLVVSATNGGGGGSALQIIFNDNGSDSSTALTTANFLNQVTSGDEMIASCTNATKVYPGTGGIKFGTSSLTGSFTISFAQGLSLNGSTLTANFAEYNADSSGNGNFVFESDGFTSSITKSKGASTFHDVEIGTFTSEPTYLTVSTSYKRGYLHSLSFETSSDPTVTISTATTTLTYDGSNSQTVTFTATPLNFEGSQIEYGWYSSDDTVLDSSNAGDTTTGTFTIVGYDNENTIDIYVYALSDEDEEATSSTISMTVNREQYSGSLSITTNGNMLTGATGTLAYTLTGNTHTMNTFVATSTNNSVISFNGLSYTAGSTAGGTATVTLTASSTQYSLETYTATLDVTLLDAKGVVSIALSNNTRTAKFGGQSNSVYVTATLADSTTVQDKQVSWEVEDSSVVSVTENVIDNKVCGTLVPVNVGTTRIRAKLKTDNSIVSGYCTVTVQAPDVKNYTSLEIVKGENAKTTYYADDTTVVTTDLSLKAIYTNNEYPSYREEVAVAADASGVTWTLDTTNRKVKASYTISSVTQEDNFTVVITERPIALIPADLGLADASDLTGPYIVGELSITFAKGSGSNAPKYYNSNFTARLYQGNTITITSSIHVASIDQIVTTIAGSYNGYNVSVNQGGTSSRSGETITFTGTTAVTFTVTSTGFRFTEMVFAYTKVQPQDKDVTSVTVTPSTISLPSGDDAKLEVSVLPVDARDTSVTWSVTNASPTGCVEVDTEGNIHAIAEGTARVVATSNDQSNISSYCTVTVTKGPIVKYIASSSVTDRYAKMGNAYFEVDYSADTTYYGYETERGAQFGSGQHNAGTITFETIDLAFATSNLRVVVNASHSGDGQGLDLHVNLGNTQIGDATSLTKVATEYEFEYAGSGSSTVDLSNRITISMTNNKGALFVKSIKIYADYYGSKLDTFCTESLRMNSYDEGGSQGSTGGNGSCKTWWNDVSTAYSGLSDGQKYIFCNDSAYENARLRFSEWARLNNHSFNIESGVLTQNPYVNLINIFKGKNTNTVAIIVIISMVSVTAIGGYFFLRKREENI